jgi:hypothetical protein
MNWLRSVLGHSSRDTASPGLAGEASHADSRCYDRLRSGLRFRISWQDHRGKTRSKRARVVDMNGTGALIQCASPIPTGSFVYVQTQEIGMMGSAYVRRCEQLLFHYQIGLQFAAPLTHRF